MTSLLNYFRDIRMRGEKAFIPYLVAGYPNKSSTAPLLKAAARAGATAIELGVPFSDPVADGPVLQKASYEALRNGTTLDEILETVATVSKEIAIPIILMGYTNPFLQLGWKQLAQRSKKAGVQGFIIADLPLEEAENVKDIFDSYNLGLCPLCAPTSTPPRMSRMGRTCTGFVYLVAVKGVTGSRRSLSTELGPLIERVRSNTDKPICVGFGLSSPEQAGQVLAHADGVILGSRIAEFLEENRGASNLDQKLGHFLSPWIGAANGRLRSRESETC